jgi:two-component system, sensor histidine kinase and response regulator
LIVDDTVENLQLMASILQEQGYEARPVPNGKLALQAINHAPPDLILLDINMPEMNGYEVCQRLKADAKTRDIPVLFISALDETTDKVRAFALGGCDFVTKPLQYEEVVARVESQLKLLGARRELERSYAKLQELERLRDNLVHMIVHDMRSPLCVLLTQGDMLKETLAERLDQESAEIIDDMMIAGTRIKGMADTLLDVSKLEAGRLPLSLRECDLSRLIGEVVAHVKPLDPARTISIDAPASLPIRCDDQLVFRVLENLLHNAINHTPPRLPIHVSVAKDAHALRVSVRDEGSGVPETLHDRIFEKFGSVQTRTDPRVRSVGLGLAFCKLAVEAHGGRVGVQNERAGGCTFWFTLLRSPRMSS